MSLKANQNYSKESTDTTEIQKPPPCKKFRTGNNKSITLQTEKSTENIEFDGSKRKFC